MLKEPLDTTKSYIAKNGEIVTFDGYFDDGDGTEEFCHRSNSHGVYYNSKGQYQYQIYGNFDYNDNQFELIAEVKDRDKL